MAGADAALWAFIEGLRFCAQNQRCLAYQTAISSVLMLYTELIFSCDNALPLFWVHLSVSVCEKYIFIYLK